MDTYKHLIIAASLVLLSNGSHAFYGYATPPPGVSFVNGQLLYQANPADVSFANGIRQKIGGAAVNVGGKSVAMSVAYKYAGTASKVAAAAMFGNPALALAVMAAGVAVNYWSEKALEPTPEGWVKTVNQGSCPTGYESVGTSCMAWPKVCTGGMGTSSQTFEGCSPGHTYTKVPVANNCFYAQQDGAYYPSMYCPSSVPQTNTTYKRPVTGDEFEDDMAPQPIPIGLPQKLPFPLPVEPPILNPDPVEVPSPDRNLIRAFRVPQGEPQPIPKTVETEPQQYKTPVIDIKPSPTALEPWRVDIQPKDIISTDPAPQEAAPVPAPSASTPTTTKESPKTETPGLCDLYPDILACKKLDTVDDIDLPNSDKPVSLTPDSGWGPDNATCPAPRHITVSGRDVPIPYDLFCQYMTGIRPIVIALAWLSSGFILIGARGGD